MKTRRVLITAIVLAAASVPQPCCADGWSLRDLWPSSSGAERSSSTTKRTPLLNGRPLIDKSHRSRPSMLSRVGRGTKDFFYKTADVLTLSFLRDDEPEAGSAFPTWNQNPPPGQSRRANNRDDDDDGGGWFSGLFRPAEPSHPSSTLEDFFAQDRPGE